MATSNTHSVSDGYEAVAFALCGHRRSTGRHRLLVREIAPVPHHICTARTPTRVTWPSEALLHLSPGRGAKASPSSSCTATPCPRRSPTSRTGRPGDLSLRADLDGHRAPQQRALVRRRPHDPPTRRSARRFQPLHAVNTVGDDLSFWPWLTRLARRPRIRPPRRADLRRRHLRRSVPPTRRRRPHPTRRPP